MPRREAFDSTTEFEKVEREQVLPPGMKWHINPDGKVPVHKDSEIDPTATISERVRTSAQVVVEADVVVGAGAILYEAAVLKQRCSVGANARIARGVVVGEGAEVKNGATVRADVPPGEVVEVQHLVRDFEG